MTTRREVLLAGASGLLAVSPVERPLRTVGASHRVGHLLRKPELFASWPRVAGGRCDVAIVGGGVSGLSAAWRLAERGMDLRLFELEPTLGGTSGFGDDGPVPYPWGAHYLPVPNPEARPTVRLLSAMGVVTGFDGLGQPKLDPRRLVHAPDERIFHEGTWHNGLVPFDALSLEELRELDRFQRRMEEETRRRGPDGRPRFHIPVVGSSADPESLELDSITMAEFLDREGFVTPFLRWFVRYATLDDFGADPEHVSAWAGIHYFAARKHRSEETSGSHYLVWPEGNGALVRELAARSGIAASTSALVVSVEPVRDGVRVLAVSPGREELVEVQARGVVLAVPGFVARRLLASPPAELLTRIGSPWLVANLHVERELEPSPAWDSVIFGAEGLGYVDAAHQLTAPVARTVWTYFRAYGGADVAAIRTGLLERSTAALAASVLADLEGPHPDLLERLSKLELCVWGHAMPRPVPGSLASALAPRVQVAPRVAWGHVDQSAMALFEEAQSAGVRAAERVLEELGVAAESWL